MLAPEQTAELKASAERLAVAVGYRGAAHRRVPLPPRRQAVRVPRGQHPPAGRAPDHRDHHRHRPGQGAAARGRRRAARRASRRPSAGTPSRPGSTPRTPTATSRPSPGRIARLDAARRARHPGGHRRQRGRHHPGRLRLDDREDHRVRPRPRRGAGPAAPRDGRDHGDHRGRRDQQELRARPARPARGDRRQRRHRLDRPGPRARAAWSSHRHSGDRAGRRRHRGVRGRGARSSRQRLLSTAHGGRPQVQHESGRPLDLKLRGVGYRVQRRPGRRSTGSASASPAGGDVHPADVELERFDEHTGQIVVNGAPLPAGHRHARPDPPGRGRRRHPPGQPRRGRRRPLARARAGGRHAAGGRRRGRGRRAGARAGEHEDGDGAARAVPGAGAASAPVSVGSQVETGAPLLRLEPLADDDDEAGGRRRRGRRARPARRSRPSVPAAERVARGLQDLRSLLLGFDVDPHDERRVLDGYLAARAELAADGQRPLAERGRAARRVRRPVRAEPQPARRRARTPSRTAAVHSPREYFHTYLQSLDVERAGLPEAFQARLAHGARPLRRRPTWSARRSWRPRSSGSSWPSSARPTDVAVVADAAARSGWPEPPPDEALREPRRPRAGAPGRRHPGALPRGRRPGPRRGVPLVRPAAAAPQPGQGLRRASASTCATWTQHPDAPDRAERIADDGAPAPSRWSGCSASGSAAPAADHAPLLEVLTRRYYGNQGAHRRPTARGRGLPVRHRRAHRPRRRRAWSPPPSTSPRWPTRSRAVGRAVAERRATLGRRHLPDLGGPAGGPDAMAAALRRGPRRARRCRAGSAGSPPPSRAPAAR